MSLVPPALQADSFTTVPTWEAQDTTLLTAFYPMFFQSHKNNFPHYYVFMNITSMAT